MRYREGQIDSGEASEDRSWEGGKVFHMGGKVGDLVVEIANITIAVIFLYRRVQSLLRPGKGERGSEG